MEDAPSPTSAPAQIPDLHSLLRRACEEFPALHHLDPLNLPEAAKNFIQTRSGFGREFSADEVNALRGWAAHHRMADCGFSDGGRALYVLGARGKIGSGRSSEQSHDRHSSFRLRGGRSH